MKLYQELYFGNNIYFLITTKVILHEAYEPKLFSTVHPLRPDIPVLCTPGGTCPETQVYIWMSSTGNRCCFAQAQL